MISFILPIGRYESTSWLTKAIHFGSILYGNAALCLFVFSTILLFQLCQYLQHGMYGLFKCRDFPVTQLLQHLFV